MAVLFMDSFDLYSDGAGSTADLQEAGWQTYFSPIVSTTEGRYGGGALKLDCWTSTPVVSLSLNIAASTAIVQAAFKSGLLFYSNNREFLIFTNNSGADAVAGLYLQLDGSVKVCNSLGVCVATSAAGVIHEGAWQYLEVKVVSNNGAGSVIVRIDEVEVININGIDTSISATDIDLIRFYPGSISHPSAGYMYWDDILILDDSGPAPQNNFVGDLRISVLLPNADTATSAWTRSGGAADYEMIDDVVPGDHDGDGTYLYHSTATGKSLFDFEAITGTPYFICCVGVAVAAKKSDGGTKSMRAYIDSGGTVSNGSTWSIGTDYQTWRHIWGLNPNGSTEWLTADVDALQAGVEVVS